MFNITLIVVHLFQMKLQKYKVKVLNFAGIKLHGYLTREIICPQKVSKPQNREIKYPQS